MSRSALARSLVVVLTGCGLATVILSVRSIPLWFGLVQGLMLLLAVALEMLKVDLFSYSHKERSAMSVGLAATFLVMALYGVEAAVLCALFQALVTAVVNRSVWFKAMFNAGNFTAATYLAGLMYRALGGESAQWDLQAVAAAGSAAGLYFLVQSTTVSLAIALTSGQPFRRIWRDSFGWMMLQQTMTGMIGLLLGRMMQTGMTILGVVLLGSPILVLRHSYKIFADRTREHVRVIERANEDLAHLNDELRMTLNELILTLGSMLDARDHYTYGHSTQVATYAVALAEKLHCTPEQTEKIRSSALLHDIGKIGIPEAILFKADRLSQEEWEIMQTHAKIGYRIVAQVHNLSEVAQIVRQHHEWFGGGGYPFNLRGEQIHLGARIISVADALDTIASDRPYRRGRPVEVALSEIMRCSSMQFDPQVVDALEHLMRERGGIWFENSAAKVVGVAVSTQVAAAMSSHKLQQEEA